MYSCCKIEALTSYVAHYHLNCWNLILTSSLLMSSLEKVSPGIKPLFFSQKIDAKEPEKKIPSTAANATTRSPVKRQIDINHKNTLGLILRSCDTSSKQSSKEE